MDASLKNIDPLQNEPSLFQEYFESQEQQLSPFLTPQGRAWSHNFDLKCSLFSACLLLIAFWLSFFPPLFSISMLLLTFVYALSGIPSLTEAISDLANLDINIDLLMTFAAFGSILIGSPFEGALLLVLFAISSSMEETVRRKAKGALRNLHDLCPTKATLLAKGKSPILRSVKDIKVGDQILIQAGEIVPLDGIITEGISQVTLAHITGESIPVLKKAQDSVAAGSKNMEGSFVVQVTHTSQDSTLAKIINLVTLAEESKPRLEQWLDRFTRYYATSILTLFFFLATLLPFFTSLPYFGPEGAIYRSLAFLIAASPCALVIAVPIAYLSSIGACARKGVLLKGGYTLDLLCQVKTILFDKTGTLTTSNPVFIGLDSFGGLFDERRALEIAYGLEMGAIHPIAKSIQHYCQERNISPATLLSTKTIAGLGIEGVLESGTPVFIGRPEKIALSEKIESQIEAFRKKGELIALLSIGDERIAFRFEDELRKGVKESIEQLQREFSLKAYMVTGDSKENAENIAKKLSLQGTFSELKPENKLDIVSTLSKESHIAFVGDGLNDAPALKRASVGIGMGKTGSRSAMDVSDVVLLQDNIERLPWLFSQAHFTSTIVKQNLFIALFAIFFAALFALYGVIPLWLAVLIHEGGTVLVGLNGLRLLRRRF